MEKIETESGFAEINIGDAQIVTGFEYILHRIEPQEIHDVLGHFREAAKQINSSIYGRIIEAQMDTIEVILHTLIPKRPKRSLFDGIGTGLKWLFGTMDENDRKNIEHLAVVDANNHYLIESMNRQVRINNKFNEAVNHIKQLIEGDRKLIQGVFKDYSEFKHEVVSDELGYIQDSNAKRPGGNNTAKYCRSKDWHDKP